MKLNLGCGMNKKDGYVNIDLFGNPDMKFDLEKPWPIDDDSVDEIRAIHVLEHLHNLVHVMKEMYRVSKNRTNIYIAVPCPFTEEFISDPTHVTPITPNTFFLFSKEQNQYNIKNGHSNTPLAMYNNVDFRTVKISNVLSEEQHKLNEEQKHFSIYHLNSISEYNIQLEVLKDV